MRMHAGVRSPPLGLSGSLMGGAHGMGEAETPPTGSAAASRSAFRDFRRRQLLKRGRFRWEHAPSTAPAAAAVAVAGIAADAQGTARRTAASVAAGWEDATSAGSFELDAGLMALLRVTGSGSESATRFLPPLGCGAELGWRT